MRFQLLILLLLQRTMLSKQEHRRNEGLVRVLLLSVDCQGSEKVVRGKELRRQEETRIINKGLLLRLLYFQRGRRNCANPLTLKKEQALRVSRVLFIMALQSRFFLLIQ